MSSACENVTDHVITINGLNIHYRDWGISHFPPLLILHGSGNAHSHSWDHVAAALADQYRVIVPDLRGHGESSWAPASRYTWQLILEDTLSLMNALGLSQTVLCGHSFGGRVAYMLASQYPERVTRLVIVEADPADPKIREGAPLVETYPTIEEAFVEAYKRQPYADKDTLRHEVEHGLKALEDGRWTWRMDPGVYVAAWRGQLNPGTKLEWPALAQIKCPTALIAGAHSVMKGGSMQIPGIAEKMARAIPNCKLIEIPDASHDLPNENPTSFISALRAYLIEPRTEIEP
jgi:pimeloyl-ACP methyl ester carboxylesterase